MKKEIMLIIGNQATHRWVKRGDLQLVSSTSCCETLRFVVLWRNYPTNMNNVPSGSTSF